MNSYKTHSVCSRTIDFEIENGIVTFVRFNGGCRGNTSGLAKLAIGRSVDELIKLLEGTQCRNGTSCPDQFAAALKEYKQKNQD